MDASTDDGSGSSSDVGRGQSEGSADELLAAVIGARSLVLMLRHCRNAAQRACRRCFVRSVARRRANRPRDFDQGMRGIMRDYFGVDGQPPVYGEESFERRFRVPRSQFMSVYEAICDRPCGRQSINGTRRPRAHVLQKLVAAFCVTAYGGSFNRADEYVRLSNFPTDVATKKLIEFIGEKGEPVYRRPPIEGEISSRRPGSLYFRGPRVPCEAVCVVLNGCFFSPSWLFFLTYLRVGRGRHIDFG